MNHLKVFTLKDSDTWDKIVKSFSNYDVYYLSGYVKAFMIHGDGEPLLFYYESDDIKAINVVMERDIEACQWFTGKIEKNTYFDFVTPYGYGGWLIEGNGDTSHLFSVYEEWCKVNKIVSEFVRYHPILKNHECVKNAYEVIPLGQTIAMDLSSPDVIWQNLTSKNRNVIRKAQKNGIQIHSEQSSEIYREFREIYNETMDKDEAESYYYFGPQFYESLQNDLPDRANVFYARLPDGTIIAASILIFANGRLNYHLSGSRREYQNLAPTNLLLYEAALWGCENGFETFHLGGGVGSGEDSLFAFKKAFYRGELKRFHIGKRIFLPEIYAKLVDMRFDLTNSGYFPRYRA